MTSSFLLSLLLSFWNLDYFDDVRAYNGIGFPPLTPILVSALDPHISERHASLQSPGWNSPPSLLVECQESLQGQLSPRCWLPRMDWPHLVSSLLMCFSCLPVSFSSPHHLLAVSLGSSFRGLLLSDPGLFLDFPSPLPLPILKFPQRLLLCLVSWLLWSPPPCYCYTLPNYQGAGPLQADTHWKVGEPLCYSGCHGSNCSHTLLPAGLRKTGGPVLSLGASRSLPRRQQLGVGAGRGRGWVGATRKESEIRAGGGLPGEEVLSAPPQVHVGKGLRQNQLPPPPVLV